METDWYSHAPCITLARVKSWSWMKPTLFLLTCHSATPVTNVLWQGRVRWQNTFTRGWIRQSMTARLMCCSSCTFSPSFSKFSEQSVPPCYVCLALFSGGWTDIQNFDILLSVCQNVSDEYRLNVTVKLFPTLCPCGEKGICTSGVSKSVILC